MVKQSKPLTPHQQAQFDALAAEGDARSELLQRTLPRLFFINGQAPVNDTERGNLVKLLGQTVAMSGGQGVAEYFIPSRAIAACLGDGAFPLCDELVSAGVFSEMSQGFAVPQEVISTLERAVGKKLLEAQMLYDQTRPSGEIIR